jgi:hypothetical protein
MARRRADVGFLLEEVMKQLQRTLRGCDVYFSMLQPGGATIKYSPTPSFHTTIRDEVLHRTEGLSFRCIDSGETVICKKPPPPLPPQSSKSIQPSNSAASDTISKR